VIKLGMVPAPGVTTGVVGVAKPGVGDATPGVVATVGFEVVVNVAFEATTVGPVGLETSHAVAVRATNPTVIHRFM